MHVGLLFYFNFNLVGGGLEMEIIIIIRWLRCERYNVCTVISVLYNGLCFLFCDFLC